MGVSLSRWLAEQTAELHRTVEVDLLPAGTVAGFADVVRLVQVHEQVLTRYADPLDALLPVPGVTPVARWRAAARADLASWGVDAVSRTGRRSPDTPPVTALPELVGVRYVLEGARLGLRVLAQQVGDSTRAAGAPSSQLFVPEPDAGGRWHRVRTWLDGPDNHSADRQQVLSGARAAFGAYRPGASDVREN